MKKNSTLTWLLSLSIIAVLLASTFALDAFGKGSRKYAITPDRGVETDILTVDRPEDAYRLWKRRGFRGRVVAAFGRRLNFVNDRYNVPNSGFPVRPYSLSARSEEQLGSDNFLFVSMENGIARRVVHVLPEGTFEEKREAAVSTAGVTVAEGRIEVPFFGSPRTITTPGYFEPPDEPALLYVNASYFKDYTPEELRDLLKRKGLEADSVVLCRSLDDPEVGGAERERLETFGRYMTGKNGKGA